MRVYLDNNATTQISDEVIKEISRAGKVFGNPSSIHRYGRAAREIADRARSQVAKATGASRPEEIIFTSGGTESDNIAVSGTLKARPEKKHIITSKIEHHAVLNVFKHYEKNGYEVSWVDAGPDGVVDTAQLFEMLREDTVLVSIMAANNETGIIQPVKEIAEKIKEVSPRTVFHTDAVQLFGKEKMNAEELGADLISISGHKIHGPKGIGALYVKQGTKIKNIVYGGHHERGIRPGTENVPFIAALGKAAEIASQNLEAGHEYLAIKKLKEKLVKGILNAAGEIAVNGDRKKALVNTVNVSFKNIEGESVVMMLDSAGIAVSSGSACTSGTLQPSHVLSAMGVEPIIAQGSIRFSLSRYNTEEEIEYVVEKLGGIVRKLRKISPL